MFFVRFSLRNFFLTLTFLILHSNSYSFTSDEDLHVHDHSGEHSVFHSVKKLEKNEVFHFFYPLIKGLKKQGLPIKYLIDSLQQLDGVDFVQFDDRDVTGSYNKLTNRMKLGDSFIHLDTGELKTAQELTKYQKTTIYHELWHVFLHKIVNTQRPLFYYVYKRHITKYYSGVFYGSVFQNESYGVYIDQVIANYLEYFSLFSKRDAKGRERLRQSTEMRENFREMLNKPAYGYRFSILERGVIFSDVNLSFDDRMLIFSDVFQQEISYDYEKNFPEELFKD